MNAIPDAIVQLGADAAYRGMLDKGFSLREVARAVLSAATTEIECPATHIEFHRIASCRVCAGTGRLFVLKREAP